MIWIRHLIDETPVGHISPKKAKEMMDAKVKELDDMAKGAALATGTQVDIDHYGEYRPGIAVGVLNDIVFQYAVDYGGVNIGKRAIPRHWEETGFGTLAVPGAHVGIGTEGIPEIAGHSQENAELTIGEAGHGSLILTSKVMAAAALRLLLDPELRDKAMKEHADCVENTNSKGCIPVSGMGTPQLALVQACHDSFSPNTTTKQSATRTDSDSPYLASQ